VPNANEDIQVSFIVYFSNLASLFLCRLSHLTDTDKTPKRRLVSDRELTFTFAICCRLSVVCNIRAPYSGGSNFGQYFYGIRYLGHPLTSTENFTEIVPGEPLRRGS